MPKVMGWMILGVWFAQLVRIGVIPFVTGILVGYIMWG